MVQDCRARLMRGILPFLFFAACAFVTASCITRSGIGTTGNRSPESVQESTAPPSSFRASACSSRLLWGVEAFVGKGAWRYIWPHDELPSKVRGYGLIASPIDESLNNRGMTKANWGKPVVLQSQKTGTRVSVRCMKDYSEMVNRGHTVTPWLEVVTRAEYAAADFHDLRAAIATPVCGDGCKTFFAFRMEDTVFLIQSMDESSPENARESALEIAELIHGYRSKQGAE